MRPLACCLLVGKPRYFFFAAFFAAFFAGALVAAFLVAILTILPVDGFTSRLQYQLQLKNV
jgi:hypothetical protein